MKKIFILGSIFISICILTSVSYASTLYQIDDGSIENSIGIYGGPYDLIWMNQFTVQGTDNIIESISVNWGTEATTNGLSGTLYLWKDVNNDGNPSDRLLLTSLSVTAQGAGTNTFYTYDIADQSVTGSFFVGVSMVINTQYPAAIDQNSSLGRSWIGTTDGLFPIDLIDNYGYPGNWAIRATGVSGSSVPEPATMLLFGIGLLGVSGVSRRKK